jgi:CubicO group peptidase (beta-lactamase class C family)
MRTNTPEAVGLSSARLDRLRDHMQRYVDQHKLAGLITMVARHGQVVHAECFGMMDLEANKPMQLDTIFRLYSMTKPITSVAVMILYEEGHFQLYDSVSRYIPEFKDLKVFVEATEAGIELAEAEREITIRDLLTHTAGLTYDFLEGSAVGAMYREAELFRPDQSLQDMIRKLAKLPLVLQPGRAWRYSVAFDVLGYLVEVISGMPFESFLEQRIFRPLGMVDTAFYVPQEKLGRLAAMYGPAEEGGLKLIEAPATSPFAEPPRLASGGGGLVGTASDYMRFAQMLLNGGELDNTRLLSRKSIELMITNHLSQHLIPFALVKGAEIYTKGYGYGLGFGVLMDVAQSETVGSVGEFEWGGAASTSFWVDPNEELIGLLMPQFQPVLYYPIDRQFKVLTYQAIDD